MTTLTVPRAGARAVQFLGEDLPWTVQVVSAHSFWLASASRWVACVDTAFGGGPLQLQVAGEITRLTSRLQTGSAVTLVPGVSLCLGGTLLKFDHARLTSTTSVLADPARDAREMLARLNAQLSTDTLPQEGLAVLLRDDRTGVESPLMRYASPAIDAMRDWATAGFTKDPPHALLRLLGLGPGLTPSGDDYLSGAALALGATGHTTAVAQLSDLLKAHIDERTTPLSGCCLDAALDGYPVDAVETLFTSLEGNDNASVAAAIRTLVAVGHTSGWDMLAGIRSGLGLASVAPT